jgi:AAA+ ATPase superfamily predicted ATPase
MTQCIIGRQAEQNILHQLLHSKKAEFLALYGRRRIGKTFLIKNYFDNKSNVFFYASGIQNATMKEQIEEFAHQIGKTFYNGAMMMPGNNWRATFEILTKAIEQSAQNKKIILFFDELPWMATPRSGLLQALDYYWNRYWSHDKRIKLIVCGSSASWIIDKIINNKGGLYNRLTWTIHLEPFNLSEAKEFLQSLNIKLNHKQILDLYMVFGGVPHYLNLLQKGLSAHQNINVLCFQKNGALVHEFDRLFSSLFNESDIYIKLVRVIAKYHYGIGQSELIKKAQVTDGGTTIKKLKELENAGFIAEFVPHGHKEKGIYYKVIDEFTLFYLYWMKSNIKTILKQDQNQDYWLAQIKSSRWKAWAGYAFESICYKHLPQIRKALQITAGATANSWRYAPRLKDLEGAQIDLLFDRDDGITTICEIKYNEQPFIIDKLYAKNLLNKLNVYQKQTRSSKQLFLAMITVNGLKESIYSDEYISKVVTLENFFSAI